MEPSIPMEINDKQFYHIVFFGAPKMILLLFFLICLSFLLSWGSSTFMCIGTIVTSNLFIFWGACVHELVPCLWSWHVLQESVTWQIASAHFHLCSGWLVYTYSFLRFFDEVKVYSYQIHDIMQLFQWQIRKTNKSVSINMIWHSTLLLGSMVASTVAIILLYWSNFPFLAWCLLCYPNFVIHEPLLSTKNCSQNFVGCVLVCLVFWWNYRCISRHENCSNFAILSRKLLQSWWRWIECCRWNWNANTWYKLTRLP